MMDYGFLNSSLGTLAFEPYYLGNDYSYEHASTHTDQLIDDSLYFNGFNNILQDAGCKQIENSGREKAALVDFDVDTFANKYCSLDNVVLDGNTEVANPNASLGSPASLSSIGSLDDLLDDLTSPFGSPSSSSSSCPSSNLGDLEFLENFDLIGEVDSNNGVSQLNLPNSTTPSIGEMFLDFASSDAEGSSSTKTGVVITEHTVFDTLSPQSAISSSDEVNMCDFTPNVWESSPVCSNSELFVYPTSVPKVVEYDLTVPNITESSTFPCRTENTEGTHRFTPYKGKNKSEEQLLRKKAHNRKSASRYRAKKKEQFGSVSGELEQLEEKNKNLKSNVEELRKEIDYLKSLMLDVINARLSKKKNVGLDNILTALVN